MKRWVAGLSAIFLTALSGLVAESVHSGAIINTKSSFYCGRDANGTPSTIFEHSNGRKTTLIRWTSTYFSQYLGFRYSEFRCQVVSARFQKAYQEGNLNYLFKTGSGDSSFICASKTEDEKDRKPTRSYKPPCDHLLLSLTTKEDPDKILTALSEAFGGRQVGIIDRQYGLGRSIDIRIWIESSEIFGRDNRGLRGRNIGNETKTFMCDTDNETPATVVRTAKGNVPIIIWVSEILTDTGRITSKERCQDVSNRFEQLSEKNSLNFITFGLVNGLPAICSGKNDKESCNSENLLITLQKDDNPQEILQQMFLSNADILVDDNGFGKRDGRDSVCLSRGANGNCSGLLISAIKL